MLPSPLNCWTKAERRIAEAVAASPTFQAMTRTADAASAMRLIFGTHVDRPADGDKYTLAELEGLFAHAQVFSAESSPFGRRRGSTTQLRPYGSAVVCFDRMTSLEEVTDLGESWLNVDLQNVTVNAVDEAIAWLDDHGGPWIEGYEVTGFGWNDRELWPQVGAWQGCEIAVSWGIGEGGS